MSIQNIINRAQQIELDRRRVVGQSISRSQRVKTSERSTSQPWKFKVTPPGSLSWADSRGFIEVINLQDRVEEYQITLAGSAGLNYITEYQGGFNSTQTNTMTIASVSTASMVLTNLPDLGDNIRHNEYVLTSTVVLSVGDLVQPANSRYPYAVTSTVLRGSTTTVTVSLNRPIVTSEDITLTGENVLVGNQVTWRVLVSGLPTYKLIPGRRVQYTGDFELIEKVI